MHLRFIVNLTDTHAYCKHSPVKALVELNLNLTYCVPPCSFKELQQPVLYIKPECSATLKHALL